MSTYNERIEGMRLCVDTINTRSLPIDWTEALGEDMEGWRAYEAQECPECKRDVVIGHLGECEHRDVEHEITVTDEDGDESDEPNHCTGYFCFEGPMMSYWYPVDLDDCEDAARKIAHLPLCVVEFRDGQTGLALTGGGMDLSWEICEAFMVLGYAPPLAFCDLPDYKRYDDERTLTIIAACQRSADIAKGWAERQHGRLAELAAKVNGG